MTSPYPQMTQIIKTVSEELRIPVKIVEGTMIEAALAVKSEIEKHPEIEVVISRAGTLKEIEKQQVQRPLIHADNSDFDILEAFWNARKLGNNIAFLTFRDERYSYRFELLNEILGFKVQLFPYQTWEELVEQIHHAKRMGIDVVVGGGVSASRIIQENGMKGMHISTSKRTIVRAILQANDIVNYRIEAREKAELLNSILNITGDSIVVTNKQGRIIYFNPSAETVFGVHANQVIGLSKEELSVAEPFYTFFTSRPKQVIVISGKQYILDLVDRENEFGTVYTLREIDKIQQLESHIRANIYQQGFVAKYTFDDFLTSDESMKNLKLRAKKYAETDLPILITGESGTGKELLAHAIHQASSRKPSPFVKVNCASMSEELLEVELFGREKNIMGGDKGKPGLFELSHGGTLVLDEIGDLPPKIQASLLHVIQEKRIVRLGGQKVIPIDVRLILTSNKNLWELVEQGKFRKDLYFRINVLRLAIRPLRERREDIPLLVNHFLHQRKVSFLTWNQLPLKLKDFFLSYEWPGNVRELENVVDRMVLNLDTLTQPGDFIEELLQETMKGETVPHSMEKTHAVQVHKSLHQNEMLVTLGDLQDIEKQVLEHMLKRYHNNRSMVAEKLGISRTTLWKKLKDYGLQ